MNNRNYTNNQFLHKPNSLCGNYSIEQLWELLKYTEEAYDQLIHDLYAPETPACMSNGRIYFGMDQAVSVAVEEVLENTVSWFQFYEAKLYGEG